MLTVSVFVNILSAANILLLDELNSGVIVCCVAVIQLLFSLWHEKSKTDVSLAEKIIFMILYVAGGALGIANPIDLLSIELHFSICLQFSRKKNNTSDCFYLLIFQPGRFTTLSSVQQRFLLR
jgi:hypothetical protein